MQFYFCIVCLFKLCVFGITLIPVLRITNCLQKDKLLIEDTSFCNAMKIGFGNRVSSFLFQDILQFVVKKVNETNIINENLFLRNKNNIF